VQHFIMFKLRRRGQKHFNVRKLDFENSNNNKETYEISSMSYGKKQWPPVTTMSEERRLDWIEKE